MIFIRSPKNSIGNYLGPYITSVLKFNFLLLPAWRLSGWSGEETLDPINSCKETLNPKPKTLKRSALWEPAVSLASCDTSDHSAPGLGLGVLGLVGFREV